MENAHTLCLPSREACLNLTFTAGIHAALELLPSATRRKVMTAAFDYVFKGVVPTNLNRQALALFALIIETSACAQSSAPVPHEKIEIPAEPAQPAKSAQPAQTEAPEPAPQNEVTDSKMPQPKPKNPDFLRLGRRNVKKHAVGGIPLVCRPARRGISSGYK